MKPMENIVRVAQGAKPVQRFVAPVRRYTRFVRLSKHFLWVLVTAIVVVVMWIASNNTGEGGSRIVFSSVPHVPDMQNMMMKPHYQGVDANNQPYTVVADTAVQKENNVVELKVIRADFMQKTGQWMAINAASGELNLDTKQMVLSGGVSMFSDGGFEFRSEQVEMDIQNNIAHSDSKVEGQGPPGTLTADGFTASGKDHTLRFNGSVRMKLYP